MFFHGIKHIHDIVVARECLGLLTFPLAFLCLSCFRSKCSLLRESRAVLLRGA